MDRFGVFLARQALLAQLALAAFALLCAAFWPPAEGRMLLMPVTGGASNHMLARAIDGGARLLGEGPIPGSFVITGSHLAIASALSGEAVLIVAAPPALCGGATA